MTRCCRLFLLILLSIAGARTASSDSYPRSTTLDAIHYRLQLTLNANSDQLQAEAQILFEFKSDGVREISLDFAGMMTDQVLEESREARFTDTDDKLKIGLKGDYHRGDRCRITVKYHGHPADGLIMRKNHFGDITFFA